MQKFRMLQAVVLMLIVAVAASCTASKEYTSKLFRPGNDTEKLKPATALRFLELDSLQTEKEGWVTTDIILGKDTVSKTLALDNLAKIFPAGAMSKDTAVLITEEKTTPVLVETKSLSQPDQPVARNFNPAEVRNKRTREK